MAINFSIIGLIIIIIAWALQLLYIWQGGRKINKLLLVGYILGLILLIYDGFKNNIILTSILNLIILILILLILFKISFKKKKGYLELHE